MTFRFRLEADSILSAFSPNPNGDPKFRIITAPHPNSGPRTEAIIPKISNGISPTRVLMLRHADVGYGHSCPSMASEWPGVANLQLNQQALARWAGLLMAAGDFCQHLEKAAFTCAGNLPINGHGLEAILERFFLHAIVKVTP